MLCQNCNKNPATIHYNEIINGVKREIYLCDECSKDGKNMKMNIDFNIPFSIKDIFSSIMDVDIDDVFSKKSELVCSHCGSTYNRFKNLGRFGCPKCYETFSDQVFPLIKRLQGSTEHMGKIPRRTAHSLRVKREVSKLKEEMNRAIAQEDFEKAANLRDKIKELESSN